jgi:hypothetical protein
MSAGTTWAEDGAARSDRSDTPSSRVPGRPPAARRWIARWWWPASIAIALLLLTVLSLVVNRPPSSLPLAPDNPRPGGARALAQILERQGVQVTFRRTVSGATASTQAGDTLFITHPDLLSDAQWRAVDRTGADLVLTNVAYTDPELLRGVLETTGLGGDGLRDAGCLDPDALAAQTLSTGSGDVRAVGSGVVVCFPGTPEPGSEPAPGVGAYAVVTDGDRTIRVLANSRPFTNEGLDEAGNAALVLRALGRTEHLTWFVPSPTDTGLEPSGSLVPPWTEAVALWGLLVFLVTALWRGRRLGRVVVEPLPVLVPPAETTIGRARLYRRARAHGHAAAALRAGTAGRLARRVGVPDSAGPPAVIEALARATGRPPGEVRHLLYGPPPDDDAALLDLVRALDSLESEVRP